MSSRTNTRVAVLKGGPSAEREVSLVSGQECANALRRIGYEVVEIDAGPGVVRELSDAKPNAVFNALHGRWGEDGCVQGILEWLNIPYTHSGVLGSALAMDKPRAKTIFSDRGLPVAPSLLAPREKVESNHPMQPPYVVKPCNEGSSVGIYIVDENANGPAKLEPDAPDVLMVEKFVPGRELTSSVMGAVGEERALTVTDIISNTGWYDYTAKYSAGGSHHEVPADVPQDVFDACCSHAVTAHRALGCRGLSRTDFRWDDSRGLDGLIVLETNTQPGMTPTSLSPEQATHQGMSFEELCGWLVEDASCAR